MLSPDVPILEGASYRGLKHLRRIPVADKEILPGTVSIGDIDRAAYLGARSAHCARILRGTPLDGQSHAHQDCNTEPYRLTAILADTHNTKTFHFGFPADAAFDMLPGDHLYVHATITGKSVKRPHTPSSLPGTVGFFDLTAYSEPTQPLIPTQVGHPFRRNAATDSEMKPAAVSALLGIGGRDPSE